MLASRLMEANKTIERMANKIAETFRPQRIILFGSWARGEETPDSDVDLLVIMPHVADPRALRVAIRRSVNGMGLPKDIVVLSSEEFEARRGIPGTIAYPADMEGKVLYAE